MEQRWNGPGTDRENAILAFDAVSLLAIGEEDRARDALRRLVGRDNLDHGDFVQACTVIKLAIIAATETEPQAVRQLRQRLCDQRAMIEELVWGLHLEARDTGEGVHPDAYAAFQEAIRLVGIPVEWGKNEDGDVSYRFTDLDWKGRQQDRWRQRNGK